MIVELIIWMLAHTGATYLVTGSAIFAPVRILLTRTLSLGNPLTTFLYCGGCTGFWLGLWAQHLGLAPFMTSFGGAGFWLLGFAGMGLGSIFALFNRTAENAFRVEQGHKLLGTVVTTLRETETDDEEATSKGSGASGAGAGGGHAGPAGDEGDRGAPAASEGPADAGRRPSQPAPDPERVRDPGDSHE